MNLCCCYLYAIYTIYTSIQSIYLYIFQFFFSIHLVSQRERRERERERERNEFLLSLYSILYTSIHFIHLYIHCNIYTSIHLYIYTIFYVMYFLFDPTWRLFPSSAFNFFLKQCFSSYPSWFHIERVREREREKS